MVKSLNEKSELLKAAAKIMCSIVTFNPPFCDASVKVISIGLDYATPETICSTIHLCAPPEHHGWFFMAKPSAGGLEKKTMEVLRGEHPHRGLSFLPSLFATNFAQEKGLHPDAKTVTGDDSKMKRFLTAVELHMKDAAKKKEQSQRN
ncbi:hypothetical protein Y032_0048g1595 [Ancylostoma ceylanicum]|nr:hypothetical protein Y032_0048g1595 [Ancylostoma ceylanicum]